MIGFTIIGTQQSIHDNCDVYLKYILVYIIVFKMIA